ncbi:MAG: hypothetical protein ACKV2Q_32855 [Planctomycetaceae bacterium]
MLVNQSRSLAASRFLSLDVLGLSCADLVDWIHQRLADNFLAVESPQARVDDFGLALWLSDDRPIPGSAFDGSDDDSCDFAEGYELELASACSSFDRETSPVTLAGDDDLQEDSEFCELIVDWQSDGTPAVRVAQPRLMPSIDFVQSQRQYREILRRAAGDDSAETWIRQAWFDVRSCVSAINWRYWSLRTFGNALVKAQADFFRDGHVRGLSSARRVTRDMLAGDLGWDASVVGRSAKSKWIRTPWGEPIAVEKLLDGRSGELSLIVECLYLLLSEEDVRFPWSDEVLAEMVWQRIGIRVARRTIAKIRQDHGIGSTRQRRQTMVCRHLGAKA